MSKTTKTISPLWELIAHDEKRLSGVLFIASALVILTALASQYIGGLQPCALCLDQRLPYYIGVPILALIYLSPVQYAKYGLLMIGCIFVYSAGFGFYHAGVEYGFWAGPSACSQASASVPLTIDDLNRSLSSEAIIRCDAAAFTLFGISLAGYNFIASAGVALVALLGSRRFWRTQPTKTKTPKTS